MNSFRWCAAWCAAPSTHWWWPISRSAAVTRRPAQALATATRFLKEAGAHAVKLEGGERVADQIAALTAAGIPVMAHIGFTPQSVNSLGGFRVQGRGDAAERTIADAIAVQEAGAFAVVMEMVPAELATQITGKLTIPTIGIGAGPSCDAQVLVWQVMAGLTSGRTAKFVKRFGDAGGELRRAARQYADGWRPAFPAEEHSFNRATLPDVGPSVQRFRVQRCGTWPKPHGHPVTLNSSASSVCRNPACPLPSTGCPESSRAPSGCPRNTWTPPTSTPRAMTWPPIGSHCAAAVAGRTPAGI